MKPEDVELPEPILGHDGKAWPQTMDGMVWAREFNRRFPGVPVDDALSWFCNAIMRGYDEANWRRDAADKGGAMTWELPKPDFAAPTVYEYTADQVREAIEKAVAAQGETVMSVVREWLEYEGRLSPAGEAIAAAIRSMK